MLDIKFRVTNVVISGDLGQNVPMLKIAKNNSDFNYDPEIYCGAHLKMTSTLATVYGSGKFIIPGIRNIETVNIVADEFFSFFSKYLDNTKFTTPKIVNIVNVGNLNQRIEVNKLYNYCISLNIDGVHLKRTKDTICGVVWKRKEGTIMVFESGKILCVGCNNITSIKLMYNDLIKCVEEYNII